MLFKKQIAIVSSAVALAIFQANALTTLTVSTAGDTMPFVGGIFTGSAGDLRGCLNWINVTPGTYSIVFSVPSGQETISVPAANGPLPVINLYNGSTIAINGANTTTGGATQLTLTGSSRGFYVRQGNVTFSNMSIQTTTTGGSGGTNGGGGGMGAGGGLFIDQGNVTLANITFSGNSATGGNGTVGVNTSTGGGGGGLGGTGGAGSTSGAGGGGGIGGNGGAGVASPGGGGGGGGIGAIGGTGGTGSGGPSGGGGGAVGNPTASTSGAFGGAGANASAGGAGGVVILNGVTIAGGGGGSATNGGTGGGAGGGGAAGGTGASGGGGGGGTGALVVNPGGNSGIGGAGGLGGGGGGASNGIFISGNGGTGGGGGGGGANTNSGPGGNGGYGGGGGGGGGTGGFGAGGGGSTGLTGAGTTNVGGSGGFGGGGGGGSISGGMSGKAGNGGFGGGGGGANGAAAGTGGFGAGSGGSGTTGGGGGGAAFGGAVFVNTGGLLTLQGGVNLSGSSVTAGTGGGGGGTGTAAGAGIFIGGNANTSNTLTLNPVNATDVVTIASTIGDDSANTVTGATNPGLNVAVTGLGTAILGNALNTTNTYSGTTTVNGCGLSAFSDSNLGLSTSALSFSGTSASFQIGSNQSPTRPVTVANGTSMTFDTQTFVYSPSNLTMGATSSLTKIGFGTMVLANVMTYTGTTTVSAGTLTVAGAGILSSNSNYVVNGTLNLNNTSISMPQLTGSGTVALGTGSLAIGGNNASTTFAGGFTGSGSLIKIGTGTLTLTGTSSGSGSNLVNVGQLTVTGTIVGPTTVASGAILRGTGKINGAVTVNGLLGGTPAITGNVSVGSGGTISPGNSIGTMPITGNLALSGTTNIEISPSSISQLQVSGSASLGGTLNFTFDAGTYSANTLTFLTASSISGTFSNVTYSPFAPSGLVTSLVYNNNSVQLVFTNTSSITAATGTGASILGALGQLNNIPALQGILANLFALPQAPLLAALDSVSPARNAASTYSAQNTAFDLGNFSYLRVAENRMSSQWMAKRKTKQNVAHLFVAKQETLTAQADAPAPSVPASMETLANNQPAGKSKAMAATEQERYSFWVTGFGDFISQNGQNGIPDISSTAGGAVLGWDYLGDNGTVTLSGGYFHTSVTENGDAGSGTTQSGLASIYGAGYLDYFYLEGGLLGTYNLFENVRHIFIPAASSMFTAFKNTAHSSHHAWQIVPHFGFGYDGTFSWGVIEPFAAIDFSILFDQGYSETGAYPMNLTVNSQTLTMLRSEAGFRLYEAWDTMEENPHEGSIWILRENISYVNKLPIQSNRSAFFSIATTTGPSPSSFSVLGFTQDLNLVSPGAELFYKNKSSGFYFSALWVGEYGSGYTSNDVEGTIGIYF